MPLVFLSWSPVAVVVTFRCAVASVRCTSPLYRVTTRAHVWCMQLFKKKA